MPHVELPQAEFKVVMLGDTDAGKTSLVLRFAEGYYRDRRSSTVGAFFITKRIQTSNGITCKIQIWDTAGQSQFRPMAPMYYRNAAAAIVCYDVTSVQSYKVMTEWLDELHRNVKAGSIVIAIAATKCDIVSRQTDDETVASQPLHPDEVQPAIPFHEAEALAQTLGAIYIRTSAKENQGVTELFQRVAERVLRFRRQSDAGMHASIPVTPGATANSANSKKKQNGGSSSRYKVIGGGMTTGADSVSRNGGGDLDTYHFDSIPGDDDDDSLSLDRKHKREADYDELNGAPIPGNERDRKKSAHNTPTVCAGPMCDMFSTSTEEENAHASITQCSIS